MCGLSSWLPDLFKGRERERERGGGEGGMRENVFKL